MAAYQANNHVCVYAHLPFSCRAPCSSYYIKQVLTDPYPEIPWRAISGFRDVIAHSYFRTEDSIIWDAAKVRTVDLRKTVNHLIADL